MRRPFCGRILALLSVYVTLKIKPRSRKSNQFFLIWKVYRKTFTEVGPKEESQNCFVGYHGCSACDFICCDDFILVA